jgi:hypothetical protein
MPRPKRRADPGGAVAELEGYAAEYAAAAQRGDATAAECLGAAQSWLSMLGGGDDADVAGLFTEFAREDHAAWVATGESQPLPEG